MFIFFLIKKIYIYDCFVVKESIHVRFLTRAYFNLFDHYYINIYKTFLSRIRLDCY